MKTCPRHFLRAWAGGSGAGKILEGKRLSEGVLILQHLDFLICRVELIVAPASKL